MKITIRVEEKLTYTSDITVELPYGVSEEELNNQLDEIQHEVNRLSGGGNYEDVAEELLELGYDVRETITSFPSSPDFVELEITDYVIHKDDEY